MLAGTGFFISRPPRMRVQGIRVQEG